MEKMVCGFITITFFYMAGLFVWIISNSYFHTDLLKAFGNSAAVNVAIIANLATLVAFVSAYLFSAKLHNFYAQKSIGHWQSAVVVITIIFAVSCNLIPGLTVRGISIIGPSDFELDFGPYTKPFFGACYFSHTHASEPNIFKEQSQSNSKNSCNLHDLGNDNIHAFNRDYTARIHFVL